MSTLFLMSCSIFDFSTEDGVLKFSETSENEVNKHVHLGTGTDFPDQM